MNTAYRLLPLLCAALIAGACAKSEETSPNESLRRQLDAWMTVHHPEAVPVGNGIYILSDTPGTGDAFGGKDHFAFVHFTQRSLDGTVSATNEEQIAKQLGSYKEAAYYGPVVWRMGKGNIYEGLQEAICGHADDIAPMRVGGERTVIVPSWLQTMKRYKKASEYLKHKSSVASTMYTLRLEEQTGDILQWQIDTLASYAHTHYGLAPEDSVKQGFWYARTGEPTGTAELKKDTTVYLNYVGRLLNGQVFDTNIRDTARRHHIESASSSYKPVKVQCSKDVTSFTMGSSSDKMIAGFAEILQEMHPMEKGVGMFYCYTGYGTTGSGEIPAYAPLVFEIELTANPDE